MGLQRSSSQLWALTDLATQDEAVKKPGWSALTELRRPPPPGLVVFGVYSEGAGAVLDEIFYQVKIFRFVHAGPAG